MRRCRVHRVRHLRHVPNSRIPLPLTNALHNRRRICGGGGRGRFVSVAADSLRFFLRGNVFGWLHFFKSSVYLKMGPRNCTQ
eukprot:6884466-Pyramimonas_sp.AAC.1